MKNKLKILSLLLAIALCAGVFAGCRKNTASSEVNFVASETDMEEEPDIEPPEELKEPEVSVQNKEPTNKYKIYVNFRTQVVSVRSKNDNGDYVVPVRDFICSTGTGSKTPSGTYKLQTKYRWQILKGNVYGQWCSQVTGNILFHSVPYARKDPGSLITNYYNQLGSKASAGCIRLRAVDAKWLFDNCPSGTAVEMGNLSYSHLPGPMKNQKLPSGVRWDPSDPTSGNPVYGKTFTSEQTTTTQAPPATAAPTPPTAPPVVTPPEPEPEPEPGPDPEPQPEQPGEEQGQVTP